MKKTLIAASAGMLAALSSVLQIVHIGYLSPWGMWIDFVAVPWIFGYLLFGWRGALTVSVVSSLIITFVAPSTWLGAAMKFAATLPMWLVPLLWQKMSGLKLSDLRRPRVAAACVLLAVVLRGLLIIPLNYYYAIPIWTGMEPLQAMELIPWWIIFAMNAAQGALEFAIAWLLVFRFRLERFALWE
jgi:riboflavin transporter FmnP